MTTEPKKTLRERVRAFLYASSRNLDLILATVPLWLITILGCGVGFWAIDYINDQRSADQTCTTAKTLDHLYDRLELAFPGEQILLDLRVDLGDNYPDPDTC